MLESPKIEAERVLDKLWQDDYFPVDPITISKKLGLNVLATELPKSVSGALIKKIGEDPIIALHKHDHNNRKRFSCAHELGHYMERIQSNDTTETYEYLDFRNDLSATGKNPKEVFANQFASHLLMPDKKVKQLVKEKKSHFEMTLFFGVSVEALKNKLNALNLSCNAE